MKRLILLLLLSFLVSNLFSNPIAPPPKLWFSEIFFDGDDWVMEVKFNEFYSGENLDSVRIETKSGTVLFKPGIYPADNGIFLVTQDSLSAPLSIDKTGDFINIYEENNTVVNWAWEYQYGTGTISYGDYEGAECPMPYTGQSLVLVSFHESTIEGEAVKYWLVKENDPSLGEDFCICSSKDTISGWLLDKFQTPVQNARIEYINSVFISQPQIITDKNGHFENMPMYSKIYDAIIILGDSVLGNVTFKVELDSSDEFTFTLANYVFANIKPSLAKGAIINNYPNPVRDKTTFYLDLSSINFKYGVIKIYDVQGKIVKILPIPYNRNSEVVWEPDFSKINGGVYFYQLDIDGREVAFKKMLLVE
ncbi:MAG: T9SS type A sorting domain-containing protein [Bacteroidales bacterium]|nr:T9SS type A sorting domain-containing protein [Bacteroidales bacterium]